MIARSVPTARGSVASRPRSGTTPILAKPVVKYAVFEAITTSPMSASETPAPAAAPLTAVTTGLSALSRRPAHR